MGFCYAQHSSGSSGAADYLVVTLSTYEIVRGTALTVTVTAKSGATGATKTTENGSPALTLLASDGSDSIGAVSSVTLSSGVGSVEVTITGGTGEDTGVFRASLTGYLDGTSEAAVVSPLYTYRSLKGSRQVVYSGPSTTTINNDDWCAEWWFYKEASASPGFNSFWSWGHFMFGNNEYGGDPATTFFFGAYVSNYILWGYWTLAAEPSRDTWHHLAVVKELVSTPPAHNEVRFYIDGVEITAFTKTAGSATDPKNLSDTAFTGFTLGAGGAGMRFNWGNITPYPENYADDFRFVVGNCVYSGASFSVPTSSLTAISGTKVLLHFNGTAETDLVDSGPLGFTFAGFAGSGGAPASDVLAQTPYKF